MSEKEKAAPKQLRGIERRRHIRLSIMGLAALTVRGGEPQDVYMGCIGRGGAGLYMEDEPARGQLVILHLDLKEASWDGAEMKFAARVRWAQKVGRLFMVGLQFEKMADERYALLLRQLKLMKELQL